MMQYRQDEQGLFSWTTYRRNLHGISLPHEDKVILLDQYLNPHGTDGSNYDKCIHPVGRRQNHPMWYGT